MSKNYKNQISNFWPQITVLFGKVCKENGPKSYLRRQKFLKILNLKDRGQWLWIIQFFYFIRVKVCWLLVPNRVLNFWWEAKNFCGLEFSKLPHLLFFKSAASSVRLLLGKFPQFEDFWPKNPKNLEFFSKFVWKMQQNSRLSLDAQHHSNRLWNWGNTSNSSSFPCFGTFWLPVSLFAMHLPKNSRNWTKLRVQNGQKDIARKHFSFAYLPVNEISMALAYHLEDIQKKSCLAKKTGKLFDDVWNFWFLGPIPMDLWNKFDRPVIIRTTNMCKNWNRCWKDLIGVQKPNF